MVCLLINPELYFPETDETCKQVTRDWKGNVTKSEKKNNNNNKFKHNQTQNDQQNTCK